jgi:glutathionylspermidine synthase
VSIEVRSIASGDPLSAPAYADQLARRYLVFDAFVAGQRRVDLHPLLLPRAAHEAAARAAEQVVATVGRIAARAHEDAAERAQYRVGGDVVRLASASHEARDDAALMRVDLLLSQEGDWRACEINADCPGGHNESLALPALARAAGFDSGDDPTTMLGDLVDRLAELAAAPGERPGIVALVYATAYAEDLQVCAIVKRMLRQRGVPARLVSPMALRFESGELRAGPDVVRVLYRYFPTEYMDGQDNVEGICRAVREGRVRTLSSFAHIYTQSKLSLARAWAHLSALDEPDRAVVRRCIPESFDLASVSRDRLVAEQPEWVLKRAYGRVGDEVFVGRLLEQEEWIETLDEAAAMREAGDSWMVQRFVPQRPVPTPWGERFVTLGAYVLGGRFAGYFARVTPESHVSHGALCIPVFAGAA